MGMNVLTSGTTESSSNFHATIEVLVTTHNREINDLKKRMRSLEDEVESLKKEKIDLQITNRKSQELLSRYNTKMQQLKSKYEKSKSTSSQSNLNSIVLQKTPPDVEHSLKKEKTLEKTLEKQSSQTEPMLTQSVKSIVQNEPKKRKSMDYIEESIDINKEVIPPAKVAAIVISDDSEKFNIPINNKLDEKNNYKRKYKKSEKTEEEKQVEEDLFYNSDDDKIPTKIKKAKKDESEIIDLSTTPKHKKRSRESAPFLTPPGGSIRSTQSGTPSASKKKIKCVDEPTRKKADREALPGHECEHCKKFYDAISEDGGSFDRKVFVNCSSRHRHQHETPNTPPGFWDLSFANDV